jgi:hypothetical protein
MADEKGIDFSPYKMGWSFDIIYSALSFISQRPVIRDYNHTVDHPPGTNYNKEQGEKEMFELYESLEEDVKEAFYYIKTDTNNLSKYLLVILLLVWSVRVADNDLRVGDVALCCACGKAILLTRCYRLGFCLSSFAFFYLINSSMCCFVY